MVKRLKDKMDNLISRSSSMIYVERAYTPYDEAQAHRHMNISERISPTLFNEGRAAFLRYDATLMTDSMLIKLADDAVAAGFDYVQWRLLGASAAPIPTTRSPTASSTSLYTTTKNPASDTRNSAIYVSVARETC